MATGYNAAAAKATKLEGEGRWALAATYHEKAASLACAMCAAVRHVKAAARCAALAAR